MGTPNDCQILNSIFNPLLPLGEYVYEEDLPPDLSDNEEDGPNFIEAKRVELEGVSAAEVGELDMSIKLFTKSIEIAPTRASGYNNRAQALRLKGNTADALADLNDAISLSKGQGRAACQSYCQRGLIHQLQGRKEEAEADYRSAASLGSEFAKSMLVQLNPYAALCNQMLGEVMAKLQNGTFKD